MARANSPNFINCQVHTATSFEVVVKNALIFLKKWGWDVIAPNLTYLVHPPGSCGWALRRHRLTGHALGGVTCMIR